MTIKKMAEESWETEGVRHLEGGRCPTPEERYLFGYLNGCRDMGFYLEIPEGTYLAAVELPDEEVE